MIECPSCGRRQEPQLICADCGSPLSASLDCFAALGLPRKLSLDLAAIERTYHDLSRKIHPDRFAASGVATPDLSLRATATLTRSYRTLRDPVTRGLYWLELNGEKLAENNKHVPVELADLVFEVQEELAELNHSRATDDFSRALVSRIAQRRINLQASMDTALEALGRNFAAWDAGTAADQKMLTKELKSILSRIAYLRTLIRDVDRALENSTAV